MSMKRKIWGAFCAVVFITIATMVCIEWSAQGAMTKSLVMGVIGHAAMITAIWKTIDAALKGE